MPVVGPGHALVQLPQCCGSVGSTHAPLQSSDVAPVQPTPHTPFVHVAWPPSGPAQTLVHVPQCDGSVGSTHTPLQSSVAGAAQPPSDGEPSRVTEESPAESPSRPSSGSFESPPGPSVMLPSPPASGAGVQFEYDAQSEGGARPQLAHAIPAVTLPMNVPFMTRRIGIVKALLEAEFLRPGARPSAAVSPCRTDAAARGRARLHQSPLPSPH